MSGDVSFIRQEGDLLKIYLTNSVKSGGIVVQKIDAEKAKILGNDHVIVVGQGFYQVDHQAFKKWKSQFSNQPAPYLPIIEQLKILHDETKKAPDSAALTDPQHKAKRKKTFLQQLKTKAYDASDFGKELANIHKDINDDEEFATLLLENLGRGDDCNTLMYAAYEPVVFKTICELIGKEKFTELIQRENDTGQIFLMYTKRIDIDIWSTIKQLIGPESFLKLLKHKDHLGQTFLMSLKDETKTLYHLKEFSQLIDDNNQFRAFLQDTDHRHRNILTTTSQIEHTLHKDIFEITYLKTGMEGFKELFLKQKDDRNNTAAMYAAWHHGTKMFETLWQLGGLELLKQQDDSGRTFLMHTLFMHGPEALDKIASLVGPEAFTELLNQEDNEGQTPLMYASLLHGHEDVLNTVYKLIGKESFRQLSWNNTIDTEADHIANLLTQADSAAVHDLCKRLDDTIELKSNMAQLCANFTNLPFNAFSPTKQYFKNSKIMAAFTNVSMRDRYQQHNRLLLSLLHHPTIEAFIKAKQGLGRSTVVTEKEENLLREELDLYEHAPEKLKKQLIMKASNDKDREKIEEGFKLLQDLRSWLDSGSKDHFLEIIESKNHYPAILQATKNLPYHSDYLLPSVKEEICQELLETIENASSEQIPRINLEGAMDLPGKGRLSISFQVSDSLFMKFFQSYYLAYAQSPTTGEEWQTEILKKLADAIITKIPNLVEAQKPLLKDAIFHGKIWIEEHASGLQINIKSAWYPRLRTGYAITPDKILRSIQLWLLSTT